MADRAGPDGPLALLQPRALLARLQRAGSAARRGPAVPLLERVNFCAIYGANLDEFFMVRVAGLHDQVEEEIDARGADAMPPRRSSTDPRSGRSSCAAPRALLRRGDRPALPSTASGSSPREANAGSARSWSTFHQPGLPGADAAGDRARPAVPLHLEHVPELAVVLREPEKDEEVAARVKVPKELLRRFLSIGDGLTFVPLEDVVAATSTTLPRDGDRPPLPLPGHPGHRLRRLRRGRRPAAGGRGGGAPPPLRRGRAARGLLRHGARGCAISCRGAEDRPAPGLRRRRAARPRRPLGHRRGSRLPASCATRPGRG